MKLPQKLTRQLCKATCDKKDWDKRALKLCKAFREVSKCLGPCPSHKHCHKKQLFDRDPIASVPGTMPFFYFYATKKSDPAASNICKTRPFNAPSGTRTLDKQIKSLLLYQLS